MHEDQKPMKKGKVILLGKEGIGNGDETMGYEMLMTLLDSLIARDDKPRAIIFWNTAVQLLATGSPTVRKLKTLESQGVRIIGGKFCLTDLCIADTAAVGKAAGMEEILDLLMQNEVLSL